MPISGVTVVPFGEGKWRLAADAFTRFGRGRHPARLNCGDCLAYATAMSLGDALLFVGEHFAETDVRYQVNIIENAGRKGGNKQLRRPTGQYRVSICPGH